MCGKAGNAKYISLMSYHSESSRNNLDLVLKEQLWIVWVLKVTVQRYVPVDCEVFLVTDKLTSGFGSLLAICGSLSLNEAC